MTVKDLIQHLKEWNPNAEVRVGRYCGPVDWNIKGISVYVHSPSDNQYCVYLGCGIIHHQGDKTQGLPLPEKTNLSN